MRQVKLHLSLTWSARLLHFVSKITALDVSPLAARCPLAALPRAQPMFLLPGLFLGEFCAAVGHFGFRKNRPTLFKRPIYSFMGDQVMYADILRGRTRSDSERAA